MRTMTRVLVVGGGPAGLAAAVAAARRGVPTALIERYGFLGGLATSGLVNPFMPWHLGTQPLVAGVFQELLDRMAALGGYDRARWGEAFDTEAMKLAADALCQQAGVRVRLHTLLTAARVAKGRITSVTTESKSGREQWRARVFVDATGDADLALRAGVPCDEGRQADGRTQPMTLCFRMANVTTARMPSRGEINRLYDRAKEQGRITCPRENVLWFHTTQPGVVHFNTTRVTGRSGVIPDDLTYAELEARRQMRELVQFLVRDVPGFKGAYLQQSAPQIGIRETRRIQGEYALTGADVVKGRKFRDGIARSNYPIDIHSPTGAGTVIKTPPAGDYYEIPYRCLLPLQVDNLLVAGRCVSATHEGQSALRIIPTCFAMGEAAGTAAALALARGLPPRQLPPKDLRRELGYETIR